MRDILTPPQIIDHPSAFSQLIQTLDTVTQVAVDTESNSLYAYRERVCLIQISTRKCDYLVDPLALDELSPLGDIFANPAVEKVFHAAEYDVMCLGRDFGFRFAGLFDTMIAARILGWPKVSLASVLAKSFGVQVNKRHQRANWGRRPLSPELIRYAQTDTHYLLSLRDCFHAELATNSQLDEAKEAFAEVCAAQWRQPPFDPENFWKLRGVDGLSPTLRAVLRALYIYREEEAQRCDHPPFKILSDRALIALAERRPCSIRGVSQIPGISEAQARRYGPGILAAIRRGSAAPSPSRPLRPSHQVDEFVVARYEALHEWRKKRAAKRGVVSDVIMSKDALWEIAQVAPRTLEQLAVVRSLGSWKRSTYGEEILRVLSEVDGHVDHQEGE